MKRILTITALGAALSLGSTAAMAGDTLDSALGGGLGGAAGAAIGQMVGGGTGAIVGAGIGGAGGAALVTHNRDDHDDYRRGHRYYHDDHGRHRGWDRHGKGHRHHH